MASRKLTIVVDAPGAPSQIMDGEPAWFAHLWVGNKTNGARPDKTKGIQAMSREGPLQAVAFAFAIAGRRPTEAPE